MTLDGPRRTAPGSGLRCSSTGVPITTTTCSAWLDHRSGRWWRRSRPWPSTRASTSSAPGSKNGILPPDRVDGGGVDVVGGDRAGRVGEGEAERQPDVPASADDDDIEAVQHRPAMLPSGSASRAACSRGDERSSGSVAAVSLTIDEPVSRATTADMAWWRVRLAPARRTGAAGSPHGGAVSAACVPLTARARHRHTSARATPTTWSPGHGWRSSCVRRARPGRLRLARRGRVQTTVFPYPALQMRPGGADGVVPARRRPGARRDELPELCCRRCRCSPWRSSSSGAVLGRGCSSSPRWWGRRSCTRQRRRSVKPSLQP